MPIHNAEEKIITILRSKPMTLTELDHAMENQAEKCPDNLARTIGKLRKKGILHGQFSEEKSTWIYWVD